ncbi:MAG: hypothetical protein QNJ15_09045 [Erythrobacter sp.]|nr:hypothetical protein [Erythrobacter sp.]
MLLALIAVWALAEAIVFFVVADVPIMALGIKAGWRKALAGALAAAIVAALGGLVIFHWAAQDPANARAILDVVPGISVDLIDATVGQWRSDGSLAMVAGSFSGIPYKLYAFAAGAIEGTGWFAFLCLSVAARLPRFALVAVIAGAAGPKLVGRFGARPVWTAFALAWIGFYAWYWSVMGF